MLIFISGRKIGSSFGCPVVMRSGVYIVNEPDPDAECSSTSQMEHVSPNQAENMESRYAANESPPQEPVMQESPPEVSPPEESQPEESPPEFPVENKELDTPPEGIEDDEDQETSPEQDGETEELDAPIAKQESVGDMQVPPPSPNEEQEKDEDIKVRIEDDHPEPEVFFDDVSPEMKEDTALVPAEPLGQSTPKRKKKKKGPSRLRPRWTLPTIYR